MNKQPLYKFYDNFKVGDEVTVITENYQMPFAGCTIRRICKNTIHLKWRTGDGYYGYVYKDKPDKGILIEEGRFLPLLKKCLNKLKDTQNNAEI